MQSSAVIKRWNAVRDEIKTLRATEQLPPVRLLVVSKRRSVELIRCLYQSGQKAFAENFLQEAISKQKQLESEKIEWHFVGRVQSNKTRAIAENFSWVHSVTSVRQALRLEEQRPPNLPPLNVLIQVNISCEDSKSGVAANDACELALQLLPLQRVRWRGLMALPAINVQEDSSKNINKENNSIKKDENCYAQMQDLFQECKKLSPQVDTLSMGTSADYMLAVKHGSNLIRVGRAIFD